MAVARALLAARGRGASVGARMGRCGTAIAPRAAGVDSVASFEDLSRRPTPSVLLAVVAVRARVDRPLEAVEEGRWAMMDSTATTMLVTLAWEVLNRLVVQVASLREAVQLSRGVWEARVTKEEGVVGVVGISEEEVEEGAVRVAVVGVAMRREAR